MAKKSGKKINNLHLEKIISGQSENGRIKIEAFFDALEEKLDLPLVSYNQLIEHFLNGFEYYLDEGKGVDEICELLALDNLGDFYSDHQRQIYSLDNAAIIYPLGMRQGQMQIYRISADLKEDIIPCLLQLALDFTIKRFPLFSAVIKTGFFWHYLETVNSIIEVREEKDIPCKPISLLLRSRNSFRILYYKKRISVEVFHVLSDGYGSMIFLRTLIREYLRLKGAHIPVGEGVLDINEPVKDSELENEFTKITNNGDFSTFTDKRSVQLDLPLSRLNLCRITHLIMDAAKLKEVAKQHNGTVTSYLVAKQFLIYKQLTRKKSGVMNIQIPVNMRKYNGSITLRNYSMYFNVTIDLSKEYELDRLIADLNEQFVQKGSETILNQMVAVTGDLIEKVAFIPLFIKIPLIRSVYGYLANGIISTGFTNLGVIKVPDEMKDYIDRFYVIVPPGRPNRHMMSMSTYGNNAILTINSATRSEVFEEMLYESLMEDGISTLAEGSINYEY